MKRLCSLISFLQLQGGLLCFLGFLVPADAEPWPAATPVVEPQSDGATALNAEAAAFVMNDRVGRYVMNTVDPMLTLRDGAIINLGQDSQFPAWRFRVATPGKYTVFLKVSLKESEDCVLRLSFHEGKREFRLVAAVSADSSGIVRMGEASFGEGTFDAFLTLNSAVNPDRLPQLREVLLLPSASLDSEGSEENRRVRVILSQIPEVREAELVYARTTAEYAEARKKWNSKVDFSQFETYAQLAEWDRLREFISTEASRLDELNTMLHTTRMQAADDHHSNLPAEDRAVLIAWKVRQAQLTERIARIYPKTHYPVTGLSQAPPLFPVGELEEIEEPLYSEQARVISFEAVPPVDVGERRRRFEARNSPAAIAALGRRLHASLRLDVPELENFYEACDKGRYAEALDLYRDYFFRKLKSPENYGAEGLVFYDDFSRPNGKGGVLRPPNSDWLEKNLKGIAISMENGKLCEGKVGEPGSVNWAPKTLAPPEGAQFGRNGDAHPFWKTAEGKAMADQINFFRALNRLPSRAGSSALFCDLLFSYCYTGNKEHLARFAAYLEDWCMNSTRDIEDCPVNIRAATELQVIGSFRTLLRVTLDERPEFARDFPAATLARVMMELTEIFHPYIVRAKRAELANWGIMGVQAALYDSLHFHEFRAMDYMNRELSRLARIHWIQHLSLDGEGLEAWGEGHMAIDNMLKVAPELSRHGAPVMGDLEAQAFRDDVKIAQRASLMHFSPSGDYWVSWFPDENPARRSLRGKLLPRRLVELVMEEPEARRRVRAALRSGEADRVMPLSDFLPYAQSAYLRDGFGAGCTSLYFQNFPVRSQTQPIHFNAKRGHVVGGMRTEYNIAREGRSVLEASPIIVDSKPPNFFVDKTPTGGKTDFCFQTPRNVQPGRFLSIPQFDVVEGIQDSPYRRADVGYHRELLGVFQAALDEPIRTVSATRQLFFLRDEGIVVAGDRVKNPDGARDFAKMFVLPLRVAAPGSVDRLRLLAKENAALIEMDPKIPRVRTLSPGLPNISLYFSGHDFVEPSASVRAQEYFQEVLGSKDSARTLRENIPKVVSARWRGEGDQALATVAVTRGASLTNPEEGELTAFAPLNGQGGIAGFSLRTLRGTEVWFQVAPTKSVLLAAGPVRANGGSLLVSSREGAVSGVLMDGRSVDIRGINFEGPSDAFAFHLGRDGKFETTPVRVPIDTLVIQPQQTVFSERVAVSFEVPTQKRSDLEIRFTLDGSEPTIHSNLYNGPFELTEDTRVKARAFIKGLKETPWATAGVEAGRTASAIYRKRAALSAVKAQASKPGLAYQYFEGPWTKLMSQSGMYPLLEPKTSGESAPLLDSDHLASVRQTDRAYSVKYEGYIEVPKTGVYRLFAPEPLYNTTKDAGYDLRVWIDGEEWFPNPDLHAENIWSVSLERGLHKIQVSYVDYRWKAFRNEYWMSWNPLQMWEGTPVLELDGPGILRQPVPQAWLMH